MSLPTKTAEAVRLAASSVIATGADLAIFQTMLTLHALPDAQRLPSPEFLLAATGLAAFGGATINFTLNRRWVFHAAQQPLAQQISRYGVSVLLNYCVMALTLMTLTAMSLSASLAWFPAKALAWLCVSYGFQKYVVFRPDPPRPSVGHDVRDG